MRDHEKLSRIETFLVLKCRKRNQLKPFMWCYFLTLSVKTQLSYLHWKWAGVEWDYHGGFWFIRIPSIIPVLNAPRPLCQGVDTEDASYDHGTICSWDEFTIWSLFLGNICQGEKLMIRTMWEGTELGRLEAVSLWFTWWPLLPWALQTHFLVKSIIDC